MDAATELADAALAGESLRQLALRLARLARTLSGAAGAAVFHPAEGGQLLELGGDGSPLIASTLVSEVLAAGTALADRSLQVAGGAVQVALPLRHEARTLGALCLQYEGGTPRDLRQLRPLVARAGTVLAAAEREARKDRFLSFAAHELKTPLTSIKGFSYSLARRLERGQPGDPHAVQVLERQAERLHSLLEEMLEVSRIDMGRFVLHLEPCNLGELVVAANRVLKRLGAAPLQIKAAGAALAVKVDRDRIERAVVALGLRALELGAGEGVSLEVAGAMARARIAWFGPPLDEDERRKAFEPKWDGKDKPRSGLGMGLALARMVAELHGGTLRAEACSFVLELPLHLPAEERRVAGGGRHVLVVDDDQAIATMLADFLSENGFTTSFALGGRAALAMIARGPMPDLLVLDLRMPDLDGRALLLQAREQLALTSRVVLLSADRDVAIAAAQLGAHSFVEKPFAPEGLLLAVQRALEE